MAIERWVVNASPLILLGWAAPIIERLRETGLYVSEDLVRRILTEIGES